ncbi:MAG: KilA-N domain-containing protein, partial [Flavobacterium sp.]|nr:KilA-N domain-containing protein [Flavobacterium sp.]
KADHVKEFIFVLEFTPFGGNSTPLTRDEIIQTKGQNGTYFHKILALKFAAWLDPIFEVGFIQQLKIFFSEITNVIGMLTSNKNKPKKKWNQLNYD